MRIQATAERVETWAPVKLTLTFTDRDSIEGFYALISHNYLMRAAGLASDSDTIRDAIRLTVSDFDATAAWDRINSIVKDPR